MDGMKHNMDEMKHNMDDQIWMKTENRGMTHRIDDKNKSKNGITNGILRKTKHNRSPWMKYFDLRINIMRPLDESFLDDHIILDDIIK